MARRKLTYETTVYQKKTEIFQTRYKHFLFKEAALLEKGGETQKVEVFISAAEFRLDAISYLIGENTVSWEIFDRRNFRVLDAARKDCYRVFLHLEKVIDIPLDVPLSEVVKLQQDILTLPSERRFFLARKLSLVIYLLKKSYGSNTKGTWSLADLEGKTALMVRNLVDLRFLSAGMKPHLPGYQQRIQHYQLATKSLMGVADVYRMKYELTSQSFADLNQGINLLNAAEQLFVLARNREQVQECKKRVAVWTNRLNRDQNKK